MSKLLKFCCVFLSVLFALFCLLLGFACADFARDSSVANHSREYRIMACAGVSAFSRVRIEEPSMQFVLPVEGMTGNWSFNYDVLVDFASSSPQSIFVYMLTAMDSVTGDVVPIVVTFADVTYECSLIAFGVVLGEPYVELSSLDMADSYVVDSDFTFSCEVPMLGFERDFVSEDLIPVTTFSLLPDGVITEVASRSQSIVGSLVDIFAQSLSALGSSIGLDFSNIASVLFFADGELSDFALLLIIFMVISLGFSLTRFVMRFTSSIGRRK